MAIRRFESRRPNHGDMATIMFETIALFPNRKSLAERLGPINS
jgi:hypothetical protein